MMTAYMDHKDLTSESIDETRATQLRRGLKIQNTRISKKSIINIELML